MSRHTARLIALLLLTGCQQTPPPSSGELDPGGAARSTTRGALAAPSLRVAAGEVLLDVLGERALIGRLEPAPADADPTLAMTVRYRVAGAAVAWSYDGRPVSQAGLLPGGGFTVTALDGTLFAVSARGASERVDGGVTGAVGSSEDGRFLVYCKGESPDQEVWQAELPSGAARQLTRGMAPTWSPAVAADGRTVVFASSRTGVPALWRQTGDAPPVQLTSVGVRSLPGQVPVLGPFPAGIGPTRLSARAIAFEGRGVVHVLRPDGALIRTLEGAASPHWLASGHLGVLRGGRTEAVVLGAAP